MATPCSVNTQGKYVRCFPQPLFKIYFTGSIGTLIAHRLRRAYSRSST